MGHIEDILGPAVKRILSGQNYEESFAFYRCWFSIGRTYYDISSDLIFDAIWSNRLEVSIEPRWGKLIHPTTDLVVRFANDAESDHILAPYTSRLQTRLCAKVLREFFDDNMTLVRCRAKSSRTGPAPSGAYKEINLLAHWANLGYVEEAAIRNHILQSLIYYPTLYDHQADALMILFKLAGATFEAYAGPSVVDRCFELLDSHYGRDSERHGLVQVRASRTAKGSHRLMWTPRR